MAASIRSTARFQPHRRAGVSWHVVFGMVVAMAILDFAFLCAWRMPHGVSLLDIVRTMAR